ncbi:MAG: BBE domain-containing protein, partial [Chloroflexota bacterium]|nr:BBE domain-containing protein [Chloroflexota bacterium]
LFDALYPAGLQWYWKADFFKDLNEKAIDLHVKYSAQLPTMHSTMHIYPINGAAHRVSTGDTAFSFRDANFAEVIVGIDPDPANNERMIQWARDYWMALHPYSAGGGYINMMMDEGAENVKAAYRDNYARLAQIKATYDPSNLFHVNQNIAPINGGK